MGEKQGKLKLVHKSIRRWPLLAFPKSTPVVIGVIFQILTAKQANS